MSKVKKGKFNLKKFTVRILFIGIVAYCGYTLISQQYDMVKKQQTVKAYKNNIAEAKGENARLSEELEYVGTDEYKEQKAREFLGYVKPDERVYIDVTK